MVTKNFNKRDTKNDSNIEQGLTKEEAVKDISVLILWENVFTEEHN